MKITVEGHEFNGSVSEHVLLATYMGAFGNIKTKPLKQQLILINTKFNCSITMKDLISFYELNDREDYEMESNYMEHVVFNGYI